MAIKYRILNLYPNDHSVAVRWYSDEVPERELSIIPNDETDPPVQCRTDHFYNVKDVDMTEEALHEMISSYCPVGFFDMFAKIRDPNIDTTMAKFEKLKNVERVAAIKPSDKIVKTEEDVEELLLKIKKQY